MRTRVTLSLLAVLVAAGLLWLLRPTEGDASERAPAVVVPEVEADPAAAPELAPVREPGPAVAVGSEDRPRSEVAVAESDATGWTVRGTIVVRTSDGATDERASGTIEISAVMEGEGRPRKLAVAEGGFEAVFPRDARLRLGTLRLNGRPALGDSVLLVPDTEGRVAVTAQWVPGVRVHALASGTERELDLVDVLIRRAPGNGCRMLPTPSQRPEVVYEDVRSPVELPGEPRPEEYWIGADGYAWEGLRVSPGVSERDLPVHLERSGELELVVAGYDLAWNCLVRLRLEPSLDGFRRGELPVPDSATSVVDGLRPGRYVVTVERGDWWNALELARSEVDVRPGARSRVFLDVEPPPADDVLVPLEGTIVGVSEDVVFGLNLIARPATAALRARQVEVRVAHNGMVASQDGASLAWDLGRVLPGAYELWLGPIGPRLEVVLGPDGRRDVRLELPVFHDVSFVPVTKGSGFQLPRSIQISWRGKEPGSAYFGSAALDQDAGAYVTRLPEGEVSVRLHDPTVHLEESRWPITPGANRFSVALRARCRLRLSLFEGGVPQDPPISWWTRARVTDAALGEMRRPDFESLGEGTGTVLVLPHPGPWRVELERLEGFGPIDPIEVTLTPGTTQELQVPLER